jgi:hypothetical protein
MVARKPVLSRLVQVTHHGHESRRLGDPEREPTLPKTLDEFYASLRQIHAN